MSEAVKEAPWTPTHQHVARGTFYEVIGSALVQNSSDVPILDDEEVTVYRGEDGRLWVRPTPEFNDGRFIDLTDRRASQAYAAPVAPGVEKALQAEDVEWVVNDIAELGVKIGDQFFFLYKGHSLVYDPPEHDDGSPMHWRPVFKREFGECAHPINYKDPSKIGTVNLSDSDEWQPLPAALTKGPSAVD